MYNRVLISRKVLLLQGPVGNFFSDFADFLIKNKVHVHKINFHWGEKIFYKNKPFTFYKGTLEEWESYLTDFIIQNQIQQIFLVGTHRPYHEVARNVSKNLNIDTYVFEEGYVRPEFITIEKNGVNSETNLFKDKEIHELSSLSLDIPAPIYKIRSPKMRTVLKMWFFIKYVWSLLINELFHSSNYVHHIYPDLCKKKGFFKKTWHSTRWNLIPFIFLFRNYNFYEKKISSRWIKKNKENFYLVPLQIATDSAIVYHSDKYKDIKSFIKDVIVSFSKNAPKNTHLLIKHHPFDHGIHNYTRFIKKISREQNVYGRVLYSHTAFLPEAIPYSLGCIVINSTVGLTSIQNGKPTLALSKSALYNLEGMTNDCSLDEFWCTLKKPDLDLCNKFISHVIYETQFRGSFFGGVENEFDKKFIFNEIR